MAKKFTLGKNERLKRRKVIDQVFKEGKHFTLFPVRVSWVWNELKESPLQAGFGASSRQFKKSVQRNRIKRLLRESWRLQKNELQQQLQEKGKELAIFLVYVGKELPTYEELHEKVGVILNRLIKIVHEAPPANT